MGVGLVGGASSFLKKTARKVVAAAACASFSSSPINLPPPPPPPPLAAAIDPLSSFSSSLNISASASAAMSPDKPRNSISSCCSDSEEQEEQEPISLYLTTTHTRTHTHTHTHTANSKNLCVICLDPLNYSTGSSPGQAIFTAQCSHTFHFACISSNVRHGNVTCPICRAHWIQLPRNLNLTYSISNNQNDPVFQILDDSIATFRVHRRSFLRAARYDDDDPIEPDHSPNHLCLDFSLVPVQQTFFHHPRAQQSSLQAAGRSSNHHCLTDPSSSLVFQPTNSCMFSSSSISKGGAACLMVRLARQRATDLVLVASPNGPHLRLLKQSMALVVFSLRAMDRLAIVTYSSAAARVFPLRRMTSYGKRTALQVIDRLFYMGQADPIEGLKKGIKILEDRIHKNPQSCILHLSDSPTRSYHNLNLQVSFPIHRFHMGFGFGTSNGFVMHEFEEFLARLLGGVIRDVQLRIGKETRTVRLGELRGGDERRVLTDLGECSNVCVEYSYIEGGVDACIRTGETMVSLGDKQEAYVTAGEAAAAAREASVIGGRTSSVESWDYHDPYMARRWAKHLHGYRL